MRFTKEQYVSAMQGYFGPDEEIFDKVITLVKVRKDHECMGVDPDGDCEIKSGDFAICEKAIHVDFGRVSCYICLSCADKWVHEIEGRTTMSKEKQRTSDNEVDIILSWNAGDAHGRNAVREMIGAERAAHDITILKMLDLTAKLKLAVEALEHYGNPDTYSDGFHKFGCDAPNIASDALKQIGEQR